jgi:hypothetical protein
MPMPRRSLLLNLVGRCLCHAGNTYSTLSADAHATRVTAAQPRLAHATAVTSAELRLAHATAVTSAELRLAYATAVTSAELRLARRMPGHPHELNITGPRHGGNTMHK